MKNLFKKKKTSFKEIELKDLKELSFFESVEGKFNELGYNVTYLRIPGGVIRTVINTEAIDQIFIELPNSFFI